MSTISASTTSTTAFKITTDTTGALVFQTGASPTTAATLDASGNLLLNTTSLSTYKANLNGTVGIYGGNGLFLQNSLNDAASAIYNGGSTGVSQIQFNTSSTERMRLDASGNLGLGVTPSATGSSYKSFEIGFAGVGLNARSNATLDVDQGVYWTAGSAPLYASTGVAAAHYRLSSGTHVWNTAASGTAGNAITFTQAMTLNASGVLLLGGTTDYGAATFYLRQLANDKGLGVVDSAGTYTTFFNSNSTGSVLSNNTSLPLIFQTNSTERARINSSGNLLVGTTSDVKNWNNSLIKMRVENGIQFGAYSCIAEDLFDVDSLGICVDSSENICFGQYTIAGGSYTERARIDSSGRVTMPYQVGFSAYSPAAGTGQANIVKYIVTRYNQGSHYSTSTGVFTAPIAGRYFFTFNALMQVNGDYVRLYFRVNGVANATYGDTLCGGNTTAWAGWSYISIGMSIVLNLAANDTVSVWNDGPTTTYGNDYGTFCGYLLG